MVYLNLFFNFSMLSFYYSIWLGTLPSFFFFFSIWKIFINNNFFYYRIKPTSTDVLKKVEPFKKLKYSIFLKWNIAILGIYLLSIYTYKVSSFFFFWNHLSCNNFKFWIFLFLVIINLIFMIFLRIFSFSKSPASIDFFFSIGNLTAVIPLLFYVNTLYSFLFLLELVSTLIFYKFVSSKIWTKELEELVNPKNKSLERALPHHYLDMLFFQFWVTFFSTIMLLITTLMLYYLFNTSDWISMYYLITINFELGYFNNPTFLIILLLPLFFGIFLKLGLSPLHLYKIEVYQGIPFKTIFFYTTYFFLTFIIYICYFLIFLFNYTSYYWFWFLVIFFLIGMIYTTTLLFDVDFIKAFFAYSTVVNVMFSFLIVILFLNLN